MAHVVFLWHMHQPYYVNPATRTAMMPWVRLHAVKGYLDMISVVEDYPRVHVNFNLTPVLMLQIKELAEGQIRDLWLDWSRKPAAELDEHEKFAILENFFKIHWHNLIKPYPRYWELLNKRGQTFYHGDVRRGLRYFTTQEFLDLQTWYNLAWCGYTADRLYPELAELKRKGRNFTEEEKNRVLDIHLEILRELPGRYAAAEARGQVELTTTPFFHPILPLVYDTALAERCLPGREFPRRFSWPQDAEAHLQLAVKQHREMFGRNPRGLWPSEGSIAPELVPIMQRCGIEYFCTDEANLFASLHLDPEKRELASDHNVMFQGWRIACNGGEVNAVFRERPLSDFIGFTAARNPPEESAKHLLFHLRHIADLVPHDSGLIPLILDGENAWETYADGGEAFLRAIYQELNDNLDGLRSSTIENYLREHPPKHTLRALHTGSWIGGNFDIWIGEAEENDGWNLLGETREFLQQQIDSGKLSEEQKDAALREIYAAEGSDWFWWYGPDFSTDCDALFDELFRQHLKNVYRLCGHVPPAELEQPICRDVHKAPLYDVPERYITPHLDGHRPHYFEWLGAGTYVSGSEQGAIYRSDRLVSKIRFASDAERLYLRIDLRNWEPLSIEVSVHQPVRCFARSEVITPGSRQTLTITDANGESTQAGFLAAGALIEIALPLGSLGAAPGSHISFQVRVLKDGIEHEIYPENVPIEFTLPSEEALLANWIV